LHQAGAALAVQRAAADGGLERNTSSLTNTTLAAALTNLCNEGISFTGSTMARPRSPLISRETAVRAGLEVIDELGLDAFSLPLLAKKLNVKAPSLYHHFRDKSEVLAEIARQIMLDADEPRRLPTDDWQEAVVSLSISAHRSILRHPNAAPLLLLYPPRHIVL